MTDPVTLNPLTPLVSPTVQPYQSYLPTAFSDDLSLLQKVNYLINYLNTVTTTVNNAVSTVNSFATEINSDVVSQLNTWNTDGTLANIINNTIFTDLQNRVSQLSYNVKTYGAKGDGVTDDTTSIQNALTDIGTAGGGVLFFPPGSYLVTQTLNLSSNTIVQGAGSKSLVFTNTGVYQNGLNLFVATEQSNILIRDLIIQGSTWGTATPPAGTFTGMGVPVLFIGCQNVRVTNCIVTQGGGVKAYTDGSGNYNQGVANLYASACTDVEFDHNILKNTANGICIDDWYGKNSGKTAFYTTNVDIHDNVVANCNNVGIVIDLDKKGITNLKLHDNAVSQCYRGCYDVKGVQNGKVYGNSGNGDKTGRTYELDHNVNSNYGLILDFSSDSVDVFQNRLINCDNACIHVSESSNVSIKDNDLNLGLSASPNANTIYVHWGTDMTVGTIDITGNKLNADSSETSSTKSSIMVDLTNIATDKPFFNVVNNTFTSRNTAVSILNGTNNARVYVANNTYKGNGTDGMFISVGQVYSIKAVGNHVSQVSRFLNVYQSNQVISLANILETIQHPYVLTGTITNFTTRDQFEGTYSDVIFNTSGATISISNGDGYTFSDLNQFTIKNSSHPQNLKLIYNAVPTVGTWAVGDILYNSPATAGGYIGKVCTDATGNGVWKNYGVISA